MKPKKTNSRQANLPPRKNSIERPPTVMHSCFDITYALLPRIFASFTLCHVRSHTS